MTFTTDLFDSTDGAFAEYSATGKKTSTYTTLIGGAAPNTNSWFVDDLSSEAQITKVIGDIKIDPGAGIAPKSSTQQGIGFSFNQKSSLKNFAAAIEFTVGQNSLDFKIGIGGRGTVTDCIVGRINHGSSQKNIEIVKRVSGVNVSPSLASVPCFPMSDGSSYWLVVLFSDYHVRCEQWTTDPRLGGTPAAQVTYTLSESNEERTTYYSDPSASSKVHVLDWTPIDVKARIKNIEVGQAFTDRSVAITTATNQRHVDIRSFVNYKYPARRRRLDELKAYRVNEIAYSQTVVLTPGQATGGTFDLLYYPTDKDPYEPTVISGIPYNISSEELKTRLNQILNALPSFTNFTGNVIKNVVCEIASNGKLLIEIDEAFGDITLFRIRTGSLLPLNTKTDGRFDELNQIGTFDPTEFDLSPHLETADRLDTFFTIADLREEYKYKNENWKLYRGNGANAVAPMPTRFRDDKFTVGKVSVIGNQWGAVLNYANAMRTDGPTWEVCAQSSMSDAINCNHIGADADLSIGMSMPLYPWATDDQALSTLNIENTGCWVQFTCNKDGMFGDQGGSYANDSAKVLFLDHLRYEDTDAKRSEVEFVAPLSDFKAGAGEVFSRSGFSNITGVRIYFKGKLDSARSTLIISAIRCFNSTTKKWLSAEVDTIDNVVKAPVLNYKKESFDIPPLVRGEALASKTKDADPIDLRQSLIFKTGLGAGRPGVGPAYNKLMLFAREQESLSSSVPNGVWKSSWLTTEFGFKNGLINENYYLKRYKTIRFVSYDVASPPGVLLYWDIHPGEIFTDTYNDQQIGQSFLPDLNSEFNYEFAATVSSTSINVELMLLDPEEQPVRKVYVSQPASDGAWSNVRGRIGWYAEFSDLDAHISSFNLESAAYASMTTKTFISETPVDGAQIFTVDSGDKNLFTGFTSLNVEDEVLIDNQKSLSGQGSLVFHSLGGSFRPGVQSNEFFVEDWNHLFIEFDIWIPKRFKTNVLRPKLWLLPAEHEKDTVGSYTGQVPDDAVAFDFVAGAWSHVSIDFRNISAKNGAYRLIIGADGDGNTSASAAFKGRWWFDNVRINRQTVEWELRATDAPNNTWVPFRRNTNLKYGALHLSEDRAGRKIELQAKALTEDAWIAEYTLLPRYVSPGRINRYLGQYSVGGKTTIIDGQDKLFKSKAGGNSGVAASLS